jgi:hypothetical protein
MANPKYYPPNNYDPNVHTDTSGTLPPGRIDATDLYDQEPPLSTGPNVIAYDPSRGKQHPDWEALADLIPATDVVPSGSLAADPGRLEQTPYDTTDWRRMRTVYGDEIALTLGAGVGRVDIEATIPVSVSTTDGGSREIEVRLWADGYLFEAVVLEPASDDDSGETDTATFGPYTLALPPLATHVFRPEFRVPDGNPMTIYSTGAAITVTAAATGSLGGDLSGELESALVVGLQGNPIDPTAPAEGEVLTWDGSAWAPAPNGDSGVIYAGDLLTMMVPVITEDGLVVHTDAGNVIMIEEDLDSGFRT